jgi:hypothetical protein
MKLSCIKYKQPEPNFENSLKIKETYQSLNQRVQGSNPCAPTKQFQRVTTEKLAAGRAEFKLGSN